MKPKRFVTLTLTKEQAVMAGEAVSDASYECRRVGDVYTAEVLDGVVNKIKIAVKKVKGD